MPPAHALLWWLPVGAGGHVVRHTSRWWAQIHATVHHTPTRPLFHAALELTVEDRRYVVEMAPAWGVSTPERGVVATGPVGLRPLGRSRLFRYEVRCWQDGVIPDLQWAAGAPTRLTAHDDTIHEMIRAVHAVPPLTWGRDPLHVGDMWNSNSLISWVLVSSGIDVSRIHPPDGGWAPGWLSGVAAADRLGRT